MLALPTPAPGELRNSDSDGLSLRTLHPIIGNLWVWALVIVGQVLGKYMIIGYFGTSGYSFIGGLLPAEA